MRILNGTDDGFTNVHPEPVTQLELLFRAAVTDSLKGRLRKTEDPVMGVVANVSRNIAASLSKGAGQNDNKVEGDGFSPIVYVKIRWPWLLLLGSQILLSVIFVTFVITRTTLSNLGVTKSSLLPVLFAVSPDVRALVEKSTGTDYDKSHQEFTEIADQAQGVVEKFSPGIKERGWVLREPNSES
ncbi:hypothetical protein NW762_013444 [Fusarium torreyae]|uniref:Uncharacterized protein n=1 Tax=Fusarium torreyae TaxID=1237075 RepID=A0A9W8RKE1_9HYPO|nr:hypothetical protein NW762_013444 [Fusarium torreyae]